MSAATQHATTADRSAPAPIASGEPTPGASTSTGLTPVPKDFVALSISNVGQGNIFVLGSSCRESTPHCAVLIGSTDNGQTWHQTSAIKAIGSVAMPTLGKDPSAGNGVSQVRFANARIGWIFGLDVQYTTDGGKTFRPYDHLGQFVTDVETDGTEVIVTFPPERVMSALAPMTEEAPPLQPETASAATADQKRRARHKPIMSAGTGL